jgi:hydroxyacylglutathione hydrolase
MSRASTSTTQTTTSRFAVEQFVAEELGNSSYLVADPRTGDAAVIDPLRDAAQYVERALRQGWTIRWAVDTHVHNDFLSGGPELAAAGHGRHAVPADSGLDSEALQLRDGDVLPLGHLRLRAWHTPGHTPEHLGYLLEDEGGERLALFSGGALMVGTIARPDLLGPGCTYPLVAAAYTTVRERLSTLPDELPVLPTHGAGSFCGAQSSGERTTTAGRERERNPLLRAERFFDFLAIHAKQGEYPTYYREMAPRNRRGVPLLGLAPAGLRRLDAAAVQRERAQGTWLVDVRSHAEFDSGFIAGSVNVGLHGPFSAWVGWTVPLDDPVVLIATSLEDALTAQLQLARIGMDGVRGWLPIDGWDATAEPLRTLRRGSVEDLAGRMERGEPLVVLDVRQEREWAAGHLPGAVHMLPPEAGRLAVEVPPDQPIAVHCATGYRSALAASLLAREGVGDLWHITDGVDRWTELGLPLTTPS